MNTRALKALAGVICAAQERDRTPMGIAFAVDSAGMLMSPESAAETAKLHHDLDGACLSLWEEEQANRRARVAARSARERAAKLRARVAELEAAPVVVYRAEHPDAGIVLGHYGTEAAAREHCEAFAQRDGATGLVSWVPDDSEPLSPEELTYFDLAHRDGDDVPEQTCTGYVVTPLELASAYDEEADE